MRQRYLLGSSRGVGDFEELKADDVVELGCNEGPGGDIRGDKRGLKQLQLSALRSKIRKSDRACG